MQSFSYLETLDDLFAFLTFYLGSFCFEGDFFGVYKELTCKQRLTLLGSRLSERLRNSSTATEEFN